MKKKVISMILVVIILLANCYSVVNAAVALVREGGTPLSEVATEITDNYYIEDDYSANSLPIDAITGVKIYNYGSETEKQNTGNNTPIYFSEDSSRYYLNTIQADDANTDYINATFRLKNTEESISNVATIVFKNAINYDGANYDVKLNVKNISREGDNDAEVYFRIGQRDTSADDLYDLTTFTNPIHIHIGSAPGTNGKTEVDVEYIIVDEEGIEVPISGVFGIDDIDCLQGAFLDGFVANKTEKNIFMRSDSLTDTAVTNSMLYKIINETGTYIYSTEENNLKPSENHVANAYAKISNKSRIDMRFTWEKKAESVLRFRKDVIKTYKRITTQVTGGSITPTIRQIVDGDNKTVEYAPIDAASQYLKSIKVDGVDVSITDYPTSYTFSNITDNHRIEVVYENKLVVVHNPMGGTPTPDNQYLMPNETATAVTEPTKTGYTFVRWQKQGTTVAFDYTTPITENTNLEAAWNPNEYNITYVLNGGTNSGRNPGTYTIEDTIDFQPATREGYDFLGWYLEPEFTNKKDGISNETGDITVYAKWAEQAGVKYKVEHYKEGADGKYELAVTDELSGTAGEDVRAVAKTFTGFAENTTYEGRLAEGKIAADGSLVLKLYYDKLQYKVTFDPKGGTPAPADQRVKYQGKAEEPKDPTRKNYEFMYWYYLNDEGKEVQYNFDDPVTKDIKLIAKWESVEKADEEEKEEDDDKPSVLPKTGEYKLMIIGGVTILIAAGAVFGKKYLNLRDIK